MKSIKLIGVRQNNLKNINVEIPINEMTVICGPSGSGKSSLAFETLFAEGQRRFIESLSNYAKQFIQKAPRPEIDFVENIPPAIALEQKNGVKNSRSFVGSVTELVDYLRLLFDKISVPLCPVHKQECVTQGASEALVELFKNNQNKRGYLLIPLSPDSLLPSRELHAHLLQQGYLRIIIKKGKKWIVDSLAESKRIEEGLTLKNCYLVIDRFEILEEEKNRISDSLEQAYSWYHQLYGLGSKAKISFFDTEQNWVHFSEDISCPKCDYSPLPKIQGIFNSNNPVGACPSCRGFGSLLEVDPHKVIPDESKSIKEGAIEPFFMPSAEAEKKELIKFCQKNKISIDKPWRELAQDEKTKIWEGTKDFIGVKGLFRFLDSMKYKMHVRIFIARYRSAKVCPECQGQRLRPEVYQYFIQNKNWPFFMTTSLKELQIWFSKVSWSSSQKLAMNDVMIQIQNRLSYLVKVGLGYLTLGRETRSLSGGEYQRIMLANQLGMELSQALYVLDEPTIGLHPHDNEKLIHIMKHLRDLGNTLVIVEHDEDVIRSADTIFEMGPGSGIYGGQITYQGKASDFFNNSQSLTAGYLKNSGSGFLLLKRPVDLKTYKYKLEIEGCQGHNLKNIDITIPLNRFVVVSGVSGSGKSTLVRKILYPILANHFQRDFERPLGFKSVQGLEYLKDVVLLDQSPLSRNARSMPVTYLKIFDRIREQFASTHVARSLGYTPSFFSLNVEGGRCPVCKGTGYQEIDLVFMDNVILLCEECDGTRYKNEVKTICIQNYNMIEVLNMTVEEAAKLFASDAPLHRTFNLLKEVGLSYLKLGQSAQTLSGGEAQRLKIARELLETKQKQTLYVLDEPTTGLHFREVDLLISVLQKLVDAGGSVLLIEHNTRVMKAADWIIELGPGGGAEGGLLLAEGTSEELHKNPHSITGPYL